MTDTKPRVRVKAGSVAFPSAPAPGGVSRDKAKARWLRDTPAGILASRLTSLVDSRDDIRRAWDRTSALAIDFIQNSARLKGVVDQIIGDTNGVELKLSVRPDPEELGWTPEETKKWARKVERRWKKWAWNPNECDLRGKFTVPQMADIGLRHFVAYGEACGYIDWLSPTQRRRYNAMTGTKVCLVSPHRLVRDSNEFEGLFMGITHDANGRPTHYRFVEREGGMEVKRDYAAKDRDGRTKVFHVFDPYDAADVRGISPMAASMRVYASAERLDEATLDTAIMQTLYAAVVTSQAPSADVFAALQNLDGYEDLGEDFAAYFGALMDKAREAHVVANGGANAVHLGPDEDFKVITAGTPHNNYLPFAQNLLRELARCLGVPYSALSMDYNGITYTGARIETSALWPIVMHRRTRIVEPIYQAIFEAWLDEEVGSGRIPFRGGYAAYVALRDVATWAEWQGPAKPTADDLKSAKAATERLKNGTTDLTYECAELGLDANDIAARREEQGLPKPLVDPSPPERGIGDNGGPALDDEDESEGAAA